MSAPRVVTESLGGGPLSRAAQDGQAPREWYRERPRGADAWKEHAEQVRGEFAASRWLAGLRPAFDASGAAAERIERVAAANGIVVTTGQQPGLFGGPTYTLLKAFSALALADRIERETGIPTAPVFWAATDDADFAEASWTAIAEDGAVKRLSVQRTGKDGLVMAEMPIGDTSEQYAALVAAAGSAPHAGVLEALKAAYDPEATVGSAYVRFLRALLEPHGIAVLDAWHPATRAAARPTLVQALRRAPVVDEALALRTVAIERAGFRAQVARVPRLSLVFRGVVGVKERVPILQATDVADRADAVLSPNVLLRPIVERRILPTVAYVAGPGEIAYFAQVGAVAEALGTAVPLVVPRWAATIVEPSVDRRLGRLGMVLEDVRAPHDAERRLGDRAVPADIRAGLEGLREDLAKRLGALREASAAIDDLVPERVIEGARHQLLHRVDRLERRLRAAARARQTEAVQDLAAVRAALMPEGQRQERRLNPVPMLARHGDLLVAQLKAGAAMHAGTLVGA
ncbi:MAG: bacillithiol biosynthesis cysteine-adding enzyme BshC [Gemmatimonadaceae bacterium]|nr:bacillithiol biosynthesis cysteine-adding enzyme BshC [Gemmatimonadaceae bacterium]